jgi:hypothetical protein
LPIQKEWYMPGLLEVSAGSRHRGCTVRDLVYNTGIPGYFLVATEIPEDLWKSEAPPRDYSLTFYKEVPKQFLRAIRLPTAQEALWAIGYMSVPLSVKICETPLRFLHRPFLGFKCPPERPDSWRQIVVKREGVGYSIVTVPARTPVGGFQLGYIFDPNK